MNLKTIVKGNKILSRLAYKARFIRIRFLMRYSLSKNTDYKRVLFYRSGGGYGDNPKWVAEYIHNAYPDYSLVWAYSDKSELDTIPKYIKPVKFESRDFFKQASIAGAWVCSSTLPEGMTKREGQIYIQTWHGDKGFKNIGNNVGKDVSSYKGKVKRGFTEPDYFFTGARHFIPICRGALGYQGEMVTVGLPRNDCLFDLSESRINRTKGILGVPENKRVLLFAPTYRDHKKTHEYVDTNLDLGRLLDLLEKKYGNEWVCLLRAHSGFKMVLDEDNHLDNRFIDVTSHPDMADILYISDILITDYSSCAGDFALTEKFVLIHQPEDDDYTKLDRSLVFNMEDTPYKVSHNQEEAESILWGITDEEIKNNSRQIQALYQVCETGKATEIACSLIIDNSIKGAE